MDAARRLALGQWFTPDAVADLALALALPRARQDARVLDPACGDGVFLARAVAAGVPADRVAGVEIDPAAAAAAAAAVPGARVRCADWFALGAPARGYDAVAGNPPYVRQERLAPGHKARLRARLAADFPDVPPRELTRVLGRGDLAASFALRALRFARPGGRVALVVSSALLDAGYAAALWRVVARVGRVVALIDAPAERWFGDAAVNAIIAVFDRTPAAPGDTVACARLSVPTAEAVARLARTPDATPDVTLDLARIAEVRHVPAAEPARWSAALRAPAAWFELERALGDRLVPLADVAEVRRGLTSGANDIFYLRRDRAAELGIEPDLLHPLVRSPRDAGGGTVALDPGATSHVVLVAPPSRAALARHPAAARYLDAHAGAASRPTLRARRPWWSLPVRPARVFLTKAYAARFVQRVATAPVVADQRVYAVHPRDGVDVATLAAVLNAVTTSLALESLGRASMGEGALELTVADANVLPIVDPRVLGPEPAARLALLTRPVGAVDAERDQPDRRALDRAVSGDAVDLELVWEALVASTRRRARRAKATG